MDQLARKYGVSHVFSDFLEMTVCALSLGQMEGRYFEIIKSYNKDELPVFSSALAAVIIEMENDGEGLKDCFGTSWNISAMAKQVSSSPLNTFAN